VNKEPVLIYLRGLSRDVLEIYTDLNKQKEELWRLSSNIQNAIKSIKDEK